MDIDLENIGTPSTGPQTVTNEEVGFRVSHLSYFHKRKAGEGTLEAISAAWTAIWEMRGNDALLFKEDGVGGLDEESLHVEVCMTGPAHLCDRIVSRNPNIGYVLPSQRTSGWRPMIEEEIDHSWNTARGLGMSTLLRLTCTKRDAGIRKAIENVANTTVTLCNASRVDWRRLQIVATIALIESESIIVRALETDAAKLLYTKTHGIWTIDCARFPESGIVQAQKSMNRYATEALAAYGLATIDKDGRNRHVDGPDNREIPDRYPDQSTSIQIPRQTRMPARTSRTRSMITFLVRAIIQLVNRLIAEKESRVTIEHVATMPCEDEPWAMLTRILPARITSISTARSRVEAMNVAHDDMGDATSGEEAGFAANALKNLSRDLQRMEARANADELADAASRTLTTVVRISERAEAERARLVSSVRDSLDSTIRYIETRLGNPELALPDPCLDEEGQSPTLGMTMKLETSQ